MGAAKENSYVKLLQEFMLQRRPYITIADAVNTIYQNILLLTGLTPAQITSFDFTIVKTKADSTETFRWLLGYDEVKFHHILQNRELFTKHADLIFAKIGKPHLATYYHNIIRKPQNHNNVDFLTAVFHLTYHFVIPSNVFNVGLIHREHLKRNQSFYEAKLCLDEPYDLAGLPMLRIKDLPVQPQVSDEFFKQEKSWLVPFLHDWVSTIQGLAFAQRKYDYPYLFYLPVYDSVLPGQRSLQGYLGIYCQDEASRSTIRDFIQPNPNRFLCSISEAYKKGAYNATLDNYKQQNAHYLCEKYKSKSTKYPVIDSVVDPIDYWRDGIDGFHHWGEIKFESQKHKASKIFWVENSCCKLSVSALLKRASVKEIVEDSVIEAYKGKLLSLEIPREIFPDEKVNNSDSPYLIERIQDVVYLLDGLLSSRFILKNQQRITQAAALKSVISAAMSRNMSHNLGSHVLSRLRQPDDFDAYDLTLLCERMAALNSYLRTRMDFLAHISTAGPTDITSLKIYRDVMSYFKPSFPDQEENSHWQYLILKYISGIDDLRTTEIDIDLMWNGHPISLERPDKDPSFSCPNNLLGTHALYIIVENVLRNAAKHGFDKNLHKEGLRVTIDVREENQNLDLFEVLVYDNLGNATSLVEKGALTSIVVDYINDRIVDSAIDGSGKLRSIAWGILEMKICATYLRHIEPERCDEPASPQILEAINVNGNLGYRFYLNKPFDVLVVDESKRLLSTEGVRPNNGVEVVNLNEFLLRMKTNVQHNFLVLVEPTEGLLSKVEEKRKALPIRIATTNNMIKKYPFVKLENVLLLLKEKDRRKSLQQAITRKWLERYASNYRVLIRTEPEELELSKLNLEGVSVASVDPHEIFRIDPGKKYVVYDRHGEIEKQFAAELRRRIRERNVVYYQQLTHNHPTNLILQHVRKEHYLRHSVLYGLMATGFIKVVLLDERIQKIVTQKHKNEGNLSELKDMNIWIPPKRFIDLDNPKDVHGKLWRWVANSLSDTHFFVVHLGIAEKLYRDDVTRMTKVMREIESAFPQLNIVLVSGRGVPDTVKKLQARFIHYSQIARYTLEEVSKYHLVKVLFAARSSIN